MDRWDRNLEETLCRLIEDYPDEWELICGKQAPEEEGIYRRALTLLRDRQLRELELVLIWRREDFLLHPAPLFL